MSTPAIFKGGTIASGVAKVSRVPGHSDPAGNPLKIAFMQVKMEFDIGTPRFRRFFALFLKFSDQFSGFSTFFKTRRIYDYFFLTSEIWGNFEI